MELVGLNLEQVWQAQHVPSAKHLLLVYHPVASWPSQASPCPKQALRCPKQELGLLRRVQELLAEKAQPRRQLQLAVKTPEAPEAKVLEGLSHRQLHFQLHPSPPVQQQQPVL